MSESAPDCEHMEVGYEPGHSVAVGEEIITVHRFSCAGCQTCARVVVSSRFVES